MNFFGELKKYGIIGLILAYFLYQDHHNRELDRIDRKRNIEVMETITSKVEGLNTKVTVLEYIITENHKEDN